MRLILLVSVLLFTFLQSGCAFHPPEQWQMNLAQTVNYYAPAAEARLVPYFQRAGIEYPPQQITLLVFKHERKLELWARDYGAWTYIRTYPIFAASGQPGPKLHEGDDQVPEGIYHIDSINPHSHYHLSLDLDYPNGFDRSHAKMDHRYNLGANIFIHGNALSIGCIAIGDVAIEELFVLVYKTGLPNVAVIIAPNDLRHEVPLQASTREPNWVPLLYRNITLALSDFEGSQYA